MDGYEPLDIVLRSPTGWALAAVWGALWGSFFNVCIHRIPLYQSVVHPRSRCPRCGLMVASFDNIPILSWLILRGKCRGCALPISIRYPLVELLGALLAVACFRYALSLEGDGTKTLAVFFVYFAFVGTLLVLSGIDFDHKLLPDRITYPAIPTFFICGILLREHAPSTLIIGMALGYGLVAFVVEVSYRVFGREGMGYGDAKLLMLVGALAGWPAVMFSFLVAPFFGLFVVVPTLIAQRKKVIGTEIPYGPFLAAAAVLYLLWRPTWFDPMVWTIRELGSRLW